MDLSVLGFAWTKIPQDPDLKGVNPAGYGLNISFPIRYPLTSRCSIAESSDLEKGFGFGKIRIRRFGFDKKHLVRFVLHDSISTKNSRIAKYSI